MIAVLCLSLVLGAVIASPTQHLLRNARDTQEVSVDTCTATETELGVTIGDDYTVDNDMLELLPRETCKAWKDDEEFSEGGLYMLSPSGGCELLEVCDYCLSDGEGWIVIQRRFDDTDAFEDKGWDDYKKGFGNRFGNYWMGLEKIHEITKSSDYDLYVGFARPFISSAFDYAVYTNFKVGDGAGKYKMTFGALDTSRSSSSLADNSDSFKKHNGSKFSTPGEGNDNDGFDNRNCAEPSSGVLYGGWWFGDDGAASNTATPQCYSTNLNGKYYSGADNVGNGIKWNAVTSSAASLRKTIMAVRRVSN